MGCTNSKVIEEPGPQKERYSNIESQAIFQSNIEDKNCISSNIQNKSINKLNNPALTNVKDEIDYKDKDKIDETEDYNQNIKLLKQRCQNNINKLKEKHNEKIKELKEKYNQSKNEIEEEYQKKKIECKKEYENQINNLPDRRQSRRKEIS